MIRKTLAATTLALTALAALPAAADIITKMSPHSVPDTIDRLEAAVTEAGATVFARVDHAEGATKVDMELRPTTLLIFGNPKLGTPAMLDGQTAGLDLPMRVLAYADDSGMVSKPSNPTQTRRLRQQVRMHSYVYVQILQNHQEGMNRLLRQQLEHHHYQIPSQLLMEIV